MPPNPPHPSLQPWQVLGSEYLYRQPWLTVRSDCVRVPTGATIDNYYVLEYPTWVNVVAVTPDDRFVLIRQYRHGSRTINFELPAGVVDPHDENPWPPRGVSCSKKRAMAGATGPR